MIWATTVLVPLAIVLERPWTLSPSTKAVGATVMLSVFCTAVALLIYFRLVRTIGSMGVASQSYLRAGVGVVLGLFLLGETLSLPVAIGLIAAIVGVALINSPTRKFPATARQHRPPNAISFNAETQRVEFVGNGHRDAGESRDAIDGGVHPCLRRQPGRAGASLSRAAAEAVDELA
jgi:multidrug transporter EmrE-like cation transporter